MNTAEQLNKLLDKTVGVAMWDTLAEYQNGNGARGFIGDGELELVDQNYGWEYRVDSDDNHVSFNANEVLDIDFDGDDEIGYTITITVIRKAKS